MPDVAWLAGVPEAGRGVAPTPGIRGAPKAPPGVPEGPTPGTEDESLVADPGSHSCHPLAFYRIPTLRSVARLAVLPPDSHSQRPEEGGAGAKEIENATKKLQHEQAVSQR